MIIESLIFSSNVILGIFLGAQIAEGVLFVPYWKSLSADNFFELHRTYGKKIYQFFAPLTVLATIIPLITALYCIISRETTILLALIMGLSTLIFFSTYFLFFKKSNQSFKDRSISNAELPKELSKWGNWHWGRICFECIAFVCALLLLSEM